jgi:hypothetical protein
MTAPEETPEEETTPEEEVPEIEVVPEEEENTYVKNKLVKKFNVDGTIVKHTDDGRTVMSDFVYRDEGDAYQGMPASMADVEIPKLDENGEEIEGSTGVLDDPGKYDSLHTKQAFPVGTFTVSLASYAGKLFYRVWWYKRFEYHREPVKYRFAMDFQFANWNDMPKQYQKAYQEKGFWYMGKKVKPAW